MPVARSATPTSYYDGISFTSDGSSQVVPFVSSTNSESLTFQTVNGGLFLYSGLDETAKGNCDGGVTIMGNPVSIVLESTTNSNVNQADFNIWNSQGYADNSALPIFNINGATKAATFSSDVLIAGALSVGGSSVLTSASAVTQGFLQTSSLSTALNNLTIPPTSAAWQATFVPQGNIAPNSGQTVGGILAVGGNSSANGSRALAIGENSIAGQENSISIGTLAEADASSCTVIGYSTYACGTGSSAFGSGAQAYGIGATSIGNGACSGGDESTAIGTAACAWGHQSFASGYGTVANGDGSTATGFNTTANGDYSTAQGSYTTAVSAYETTFGCYNLQSTPADATSWNGLDGLFRVGNGDNNVPSDAVTVLKSGQTTLTNKAWKAAVNVDSTTALADPDVQPANDASGGNALVVDGHTVLNGKVTIAVPQGDISMGIYGN